jgi:pilus assembly protein CpaF
MTAVDIVDAEVRELIRRRGLDPTREPVAVRRLIDEVLADYSDRALTGALPALADPSSAARTVYDTVAGLGPLQRFLDDPDVEEIWVNGPGRVFVARHGRSELTTAILSAGQVADLVERMLKGTGRRVDLSTPFVDAMLPDGSRLHVVIPDITRRDMAVNIRKFVIRAASLDELVGLGTLTPSAAGFLEAAVVAGLNVVVSGGTQAGKTTLLNCLAAAVPASERVISCEEVFELKLPLPDWVAMQTRQPNLEGAGEIPLRRLVKEALRMRPSRLIVGEVRQAECLDLLIALNSGVPGMASLHANSAREAVTKLCTLPLLAGENVTTGFVVPTVASCVDVVVHTEVDGRGQRRVREIVGVTGRSEGTVVETADLYTTRAGRLVRAEGYPPHGERFDRAGYDLAALLRAGG